MVRISRSTGWGLKYEKLYAGKDIPMPRTRREDVEAKPPHFRDQQKLSEGLTDDVIRQMRVSYYSKISMIDEKIGGILEAFRQRGEYDRTLILLTADHGDYMGDFGFAFKAQYLSEALMRIPMLAKPPVPKFQGRREAAFVQNFDIAATALVAAGVEVPKTIASADLSTFWRNPQKAVRREYCFFDGHDLQGVRDGRWKLVHYGSRPYGELYDLRDDPEERRNLWAMAAGDSLEAKARLGGKLLDHLISIRPRAEAEWNQGAPKI
jgi:arylsulfatase